MSGGGGDPRVALGPALAPGAAAPILERLDRLRPVVRIEAGSPEPVALAGAALYSLLARVHAHTTIDGDAALGPNPWGVSGVGDLPARLAASLPAAASDPEQDLVIGAGPRTERASLWIGGDDWTARAGPSPQDVSGHHGLGLQAAAVFAAAEALKVALGDEMIQVPIGEGLVWNLFDHRNQPGPEIEATGGRLDRVVFCGAGSVTSSAVGIIRSQEGLNGSAEVVDPDPYDPERNPFRYPASTGLETGAKSEWAAGLLRAAGWDAVGHPTDVGSWVRAQADPGVGGLVVSSVDTVAGRLQVADALGRTTLSVGVESTALHIQREHCYDDLACPYCDFVSAGTPLSQAQVHNQMTSLPVERIVQLHLGGHRLTAEDLGQVVSAGKLHPDRVGDLIGRRLDDLIQRVYAQAVVAGAGQSNPGAVTTVSTPFVSWMGGLLVAAELAKAAIGAPLVDRRVDLELAGLPLGAVSRRPRDTSGQCVCHSPHRQRWAARLCGSDRVR